MEDLTSVLVAFGAGIIVALIVAMKRRSKPEEAAGPDTRPSSQIAKDNINEGLQGGLDGIKEDLESENPDRDISLYINSPGGDINALFAVYDTMQYIKPDINTICFGQAASAAAVLLAAGTKGKRLALPHSRVLIHQPYAGAQGQVSDIELASREIQRLKAQLEEILARHTGQDVARIHADTDRDFVMTAAEAKEYGIIDEVIDTRSLPDNSGAIAAVT